MTRQAIGFGLMCKPPRAGVTKTRLAASIGHETAARLSRAFLQDCAAVALDTAQSSGLDPAAFYRPADAGDALAAILGPRWPLSFADAGDLGATMRSVLEQLLARCPDGAIIMGADIPLITKEAIARATDSLRHGDERRVTVIPSADGGYCLIGVRSARLAAPLFAPMAWSTPDVFSRTLDRAGAAGLDVAVQPAERDIDEPPDLDWLRTQLATRLDVAPATRSALAAMETAPALGRVPNG
jgi:rSAM/selenodomain-associated transferase 1